MYKIISVQGTSSLCHKRLSLVSKIKIQTVSSEHRFLSYKDVTEALSLTHYLDVPSRIFCVKNKNSFIVLQPFINL